MTADRELGPLPEPYKAPASIFCASCGAPYEPSRAFAPCAAGMGAPLYSNHGCKCGGNSFRGTIDSSGPRAAYTADQMRAYAAAEVARERERCAKLCEDMQEGKVATLYDWTKQVGTVLAAAIRSQL